MQQTRHCTSTLSDQCRTTLPARAQPFRATGARWGLGRPCVRIIPAQSYSGGSQPSGSGFYPPVPGYNQPQPVYDPTRAYDPAYAPSAPPLSSSPDGSQYGSETGSYGYSAAPSEVPLPTEAEELEAAEQAMLQDSAGYTKTLSFLGFWSQFALSLVSAGILLFSVGFVPRPEGMGTAGDISKYLTLVGVISAFISALFAHGFLTLSRKLMAGGKVGKGYLVGTLLTNNAICLAGIAITVIGLQASVGTLVAKTLTTVVSGPYTVSQAGNALVSLDVFALQASTNTLLCHVIGLLFTNLMLRAVNKTPKPATVTPLAGQRWSMSKRCTD